GPGGVGGVPVDPLLQGGDPALQCLEPGPEGDLGLGRHGLPERLGDGRRIGHAAWYRVCPWHGQHPTDERLPLRDQGQGHALCARFWAILGESAARLTQRQLRAAAALATLDPDDSRWRSLATPIAAGLVREDPRLLDAWREVFFPLADRLEG